MQSIPVAEEKKKNLKPKLIKINQSNPRRHKHTYSQRNLEQLTLDPERQACYSMMMPSNSKQRNGASRCDSENSRSIGSRSTIKKRQETYNNAFIEAYMQKKPRQAMKIAD